MTLSAPEEAFAQLVRIRGLPKPEREYEFDPDRRWRFDFAWPAQKVAVEIEGGARSGGRHVRGQGFVEDAEKHLAALAAGWRVVRVPSEWAWRKGRIVEHARLWEVLEEILQ